MLNSGEEIKVSVELKKKQNTHFRIPFLQVCWAVPARSGSGSETSSIHHCAVALLRVMKCGAGAALRFVIKSGREAAAMQGDCGQSAGHQVTQITVVSCKQWWKETNQVLLPAFMDGGRRWRALLTLYYLIIKMRSMLSGLQERKQVVLRQRGFTAPIVSVFRWCRPAKRERSNSNARDPLFLTSAVVIMQPVLANVSSGRSLGLTVGIQTLPPQNEQSLPPSHKSSTSCNLLN